MNTSVKAPGPPDALCLDFTNTRYWRGRAEPTEELHRPADLLAWCRRAGALEAETIEQVAARWETAPEEGATALAIATLLREAIFRLFAATASGGAVQQADLAALNRALRVAPERGALRRDGEAYVWEVTARGPDAMLLLGPVLWSAGDLLAGPRRGRVRQCANPECRFLFVDDSKSGNRRWCSMASCGNRAKAHRHYARKKAGGTASARREDA